MRNDGLRSSLRATGLKAEPRVIVRPTLEKHDRHAPSDHHFKAGTYQRRSDPLSLMFGLHPDGTEYLHVNEPARSVEQAPGEHHVPDHTAAVLGDQRQPIVAGNELSQILDELGDDGAVIAKRAAMHAAHGPSIIATFGTNCHAQMLCAPSSARIRNWRSAQAYEEGARPSWDRWPTMPRRPDGPPKLRSPFDGLMAADDPSALTPEALSRRRRSRGTLLGLRSGSAHTTYSPASVEAPSPRPVRDLPHFDERRSGSGCSSGFGFAAAYADLTGRRLACSP